MGEPQGGGCGWAPSPRGVVHLVGVGSPPASAPSSAPLAGAAYEASRRPLGRLGAGWACRTRKPPSRLGCRLAGLSREGGAGRLARCFGLAPSCLEGRGDRDARSWELAFQGGRPGGGLGLLRDADTCVTMPPRAGGEGSDGWHKGWL